MGRIELPLLGGQSHAPVLVRQDVSSDNQDRRAHLYPWSRIAWKRNARLRHNYRSRHCHRSGRVCVVLVMAGFGILLLLALRKQ